MVHGLFTAGLAESTQKAYRSGSNRYLRFCQEANLTPYPASERVVLLFIAHLHEAHLAHGTVKSYLAAIRYEQIRRGLGNPSIHDMPQVEYVLKGVKKATPASTRTRLPITPGILRGLKRVWHQEPNQHDAKMLWAAACLCFAGFLRSGEATCPTEHSFNPATHLCFTDVAVNSRAAPTALRVAIKASKTDPFRQAVTLHIGVAGGALCPVAAVLRYMVARGNAAGPLFCWEDGRYPTRNSFVKSVRAALTTAGYYAGHSFCI